MSPLWKACAECSAPAMATYCDDCRPAAAPKQQTAARGYDWQWQKLSKRARRMQPWCSDCLGTTDLQADHSPEAWERKAKGLTIRLCDIDVVCGPCNVKRGAARGEAPRGEGAQPSPHDPRRQAKFAFHTPGGYPWQG